ncbi:SDR family oxidoreductase [bacterium]|nr:SDR family oxidoreductase [bacterium]
MAGVTQHRTGRREVSESSTMQGRTIAITGVLGGLGHSLAERFLSEGATLVGIDNGDPGASSPLHTAWQLDRLKQHESFIFLPLDIRSIEREDLLVAGKPVDLLINCAAVPPSRRAPTPQTLIEEVHQLAILRLIDLATTSGVSQILLPNYLPMQPDDPREQDEEWRWLIEAEAEVRQVVADKESVHAIPLPSLVGFGQSLRTTPVVHYLQALARLPLSLPDQTVPVAVASQEECVTQLHHLFVSDNSNKSYNLLDTLTISSIPLSDLLNPLLKEAELEVEFTSDPAPAWGAYLPKRVDTTLSENLVDRVTEWLGLLPHVPPADWPDVPARERRIMRSRRRRAKRNRTSGNE